MTGSSQQSSTVLHSPEQDLPRRGEHVVDDAAAAAEAGERRLAVARRLTRLVEEPEVRPDRDAPLTPVSRAAVARVRPREADVALANEALLAVERSRARLADLARSPASVDVVRGATAHDGDSHRRSDAADPPTRMPTLQDYMEPPQGANIGDRRSRAGEPQRRGRGDLGWALTAGEPRDAEAQSFGGGRAREGEPRRRGSAEFWGLGRAGPTPKNSASLRLCGSLSSPPSRDERGRARCRALRGPCGRRTRCSRRRRGALRRR